MPYPGLILKKYKKACTTASLIFIFFICLFSFPHKIIGTEAPHSLLSLIHKFSMEEGRAELKYKNTSILLEEISISIEGIHLKASAQGVVSLNNGDEQQRIKFTLSTKKDGLEYEPSSGIKGNLRLQLDATQLMKLLGRPAMDLELTLKASPDLKKGSLSTSFPIQDIPIRALFKWNDEEKSPWSFMAVLEAKNYEISRLLRVSIFSDLFKDLNLKGLGDIFLEIRGDQNLWAAKGDMDLRNLTFSKGTDLASEGVNLSIKAEASSSLPFSEHIMWNLSGNWDKGGFLYYPWFFDLSMLKGGMDVSGDTDGEKLLIKDISMTSPLKFKAGDILIDLKKPESSLLRPEFLNASGKMEPFYSILLKEPYSLEYKLLNAIEPEGSWSLSFKKDILSMSLDADIKLKNYGNIKALKADISYPLSQKSCQRGRIEWKELTYGDISSHEGNIPLRICKDSLSAGPFALPLSNGEVSLDRFSFNLNTKDIEFKKFKTKNLEIASLIPGSGLHALLNANFEKGHLSDGRLALDGSMNISSAEGFINMDGIWLEPYHFIPRWGGDIQIQSMDLSEITKATGFGLITGRLNGKVENLVVSGIQPEAFKMTLFTDPDAPGSRKISVKAIENISILGGGGIIPFWGRLFKTFSYKRIGISCSLLNDVFTLRGLIKKDNLEYLVERGLFGGVNVINRNPEGQISFRDMMDRLKRVAERKEEEEGI